MNAKTLIILISVFAAFLRCVHTNLAGPGQEGNGSQTLAKGIIVDHMGAPAAGVPVQLLPAGYNPLAHARLPNQWHTTTNAFGAYSMNNIDVGTYAIEAGGSSESDKVLVKGIEVSGRDTQVIVDTGRMEEPGTVIVRFSGIKARVGDYFYLPGTNSYTVIDAVDSVAGQTVLSDVPAGTFTDLLYVTMENSQSANILAGALTVRSGDTVASAYAGWRYSKRLFLNTTASGAAVGGNAYGFPVLVRLTDTIFDFSQAKSSGEDIRFAKSDGSPLGHEIERWDAGRRRAEIWVRVDTVRGNDSSQSVTMYWGNPDASGGSNGAEVFGVAAGFTGVWHLNENGDSVYDATGDAFNGMNSGSTMTTGIIGNSRKFANGNFIKISGLLNTPSNVTLSAWVRYDTASKGQDVFSIGDAVLIRLDDSINGMGTIGSYHNDSMVNDSNYSDVCSRRFLAKTGWHYIAYSINSTTQTQTFYIDGAQCAISHDLNPIYYSGLGADTYIGKHGNGKTIFNFIGQVDEIRANHISLSADWIKLCFMNQKAQDVLVRW